MNDVSSILNTFMVRLNLLGELISSSLLSLSLEFAVNALDAISYLGLTPHSLVIFTSQCAENYAKYTKK